MSRTGVDLTTELSPFLPAPGPTERELAALRDWLPARRWFPVKSGLESIEPWVSIRFADDSDTVIHIFIAHGKDGSALVQVPVLRRAATERDTPRYVGAAANTAPPGLIVNLDDDVLLDAFHEESFWRSWLLLAQWGEADDGAAEKINTGGALFISGEQSNSSVILPNVAGGAILKIFRGLARGPNPDVDVPRALVQTGWDGVPRPLAWLELTWSDRGIDLLDLGVLSELVPDASDGFQLACAYAAENRSFATHAHQLGRTIAQMHTALRAALPTDNKVSIEWLRTELRRRAREAIAAEPALAGRAGAIENILTGIGRNSSADHPLNELQHIHGDLHLGQALFSDTTGWRILDFEGEPMRPVGERLRPDLPARDLAGILRSFDYAAAVGETTDTNWTTDAREAFLNGYNTKNPRGLDPQLLRALELDKALYEVRYETANRPDWVQIPLAGLDRLLTETNTPK